MAVFSVFCITFVYAIVAHRMIRHIHLAGLTKEQNIIMELLVYKASAGSGKTFTLAVEYIKHLVLNQRAYQQILAVTFTNKATTEMKTRILQQLHGIWKGEKKSDTYLNCIQNELKKSGSELTDNEIRQRCGNALMNMLHDYSRFRVETIDSFFQSVMRNLARELELSPDLNIELNNSEVLNDAVDSLIEKLTPTSPVLAWLLSYIDERIADNKRWNVAQELKNFGRNIFDESYMERGGLLREKLRNPDAIRLYRDVLREQEEKALEQMRKAGERFEEELESNNLSTEDLRGRTKGIGSYFRKLRDGRIKDKDVLNETLNKCLASADNWASKTSARRKEIVQLVQNSLLPLLEKTEKERPAKNHTVNTCRLSLQHLNKLQLLNHIDEEVRSQNAAHNRFLLSDTNVLLHKLIGKGDPSFVFEKLGASIRSVMIDEFQDTSRMQWDNFRLLLLEGLAQGADSLIVGDVKQSIYRWRNGDWKILNELGRTKLEDYFPVRVESLRTNRRSETNIIRFNNSLFNAAVDFLNQRHLAELGEECLPLKNAYADVAQESPKAIAKGYVRACFVEPGDGLPYTEAILCALGEETLHLLDKGIAPKDIAILVRKNKNIFQIATYLEQTLHLPVVSDEAFRLDASPSICMLMDALRCLAHPEESIARASLVMNYRHMYDISPDWDDLLARDADTLLPTSFTGRFEALRLMPLYELLEELYRTLELERFTRQDAYVFSFFDAVTEYLQNHSSDPDSFIRYWDETLCAKTIPGGEPEGIRILSIHKSKGLEFHTVLVPFCDWKLENETNNQLVWCVPPEAPYNMLDLVPVNYGTSMAESIYRQDYLQERMQLWVDNLNLLYVAFTRAGSNLLLWSRKGQKGTMSELLADVLPRIAAAGEGNWNEETGIYESGDITLASGPPAPENKSPLPVCMKSMEHPVEFRQSNRSADFIANKDESGSPQRFIDRGRLLHTLFSAIETEADIDNALERLVFEGVIAHQETEEEIRRLTRKAFSHPQAKDWYSGRWELFNECDIIWIENGQLHKRRPDRVMIKGKEMVVVDFKFGKPHRQYATQVREYMRLLGKMGYGDSRISGYLWYVDQGEIEEV